MTKERILNINFEGNKIVIRERKNPKGKPPFYLWDITRMKYISSLYDTDNEGVKRFEISGRYYLLDTNTGKQTEVSLQGA